MRCCELIEEVAVFRPLQAQPAKAELAAASKQGRKMNLAMLRMSCSSEHPGGAGWHDAAQTHDDMPPIHSASSDLAPAAHCYDAPPRFST